MQLTLHLQHRKCLRPRTLGLAADRGGFRTPLPVSRDGVIQDGSISVIKFTPNTCFTVPASVPPPSNNFEHGTCSVCLLQRMNLHDGGADFQLWARDNGNNAMGATSTKIWPLDDLNVGAGSVADNMPTFLMGGSNFFSCQLC